jgi:hypothetical protein
MSTDMMISLSVSSICKAFDPLPLTDISEDARVDVLPCETLPFCICSGTGVAVKAERRDTVEREVRRVLPQL